MLRRAGLQPPGSRRRVPRHGHPDARHARQDPARRRPRVRGGGRGEPEGGALRGHARARGRGVSRRHSRHDRRRARDERRLLRFRDLGVRRARRHHRSAGRGARAHGARVRDGLPARCPARAGRSARTSGSPAPGSAFRRGDGAAGARAHQGAARQAHRHAAAQPAQRGLGLPQPARRPRGAPGRGVRPQGLRDRACADLRQARELHRESGREGLRSGHRGADRACPRSGAEALRRRARARGADHRRGSGSA